MSDKTQRSKTKGDLTDEQKGELEEAFTYLDIDGDGVLSTRDLKLALRSIGFEAKKAEILHMIRDADLDEKSGITLQGFMKMMTRKRDEMNPEDEILRAFKLFSENESEGIRISDIKKVAQELGEELTEDELKDIFEEADRENDGMISLEEFSYVMRKTSIF